ncbi:MAG: cytochrome C biosynthesis protein [Bacteroides sp.]|nr:cytochrome C biosynthesis protein [Bacteroides sp.]
MKRLFIIPLLSALLWSCGGKPSDASISDKQPTLRPDYAGVTLPRDIAAPAFVIADTASRYFTEIGRCGELPAMTFSSASGEVVPPLGKWHSLLDEAAGDSIYIRVTLTDAHGRSEQLRDVVCGVSADSIDSWLVYRLLYPGYELWREMGIYQRNLNDYTQEAVIDNKEIDLQCVNCHNFAGGAPETMMIHVRGAKGGTLLRRDGKTVKVDPKCAALENGATYPAWHPSGRFIAFSANEIRQFFHTSGTKAIEVSDLMADMTLYDVEANKSEAVAGLEGEEWMETFPTWSPDGSRLYFCRAKGYREGTPLDSIRYDLCSIGFDPATSTFTTPEVVYPAAERGESVSFPRVDPTGRWLLFTLSSYGNFSIWHPESNLILLDLTDGTIREVTEINSNDVDSYHSWAPNGRWVVFSSKRMDGLWARPFIASFDPSTGRFGRPFPVPQDEPRFYDDFMKTFNVPELIARPITETAEFVETVNK